MNLTPINYPSILSPAGGISVEDTYERGSRSATWGVDDVRLNRTYKNVLKVQTGNKYAGPLQVIQATGAVIGMYYQFPYFASSPTENDTGSYLRTITVDQDSEDNRQWLVTLEYEPFDVWSLLGSSDINQGLVNPLDRAWEVYWAEPAKYRRSKPYDESGMQGSEPGKPYLNTIGDPLLDPPETEETRPVLCVVRNESTYNNAYAEQYKDSVNSDVFLGFPPNSVKCRDVKGDQRIWDPDWGWYFRVTYQFEFDDDDDGNGFTYMALNAGYRQKAGGTGNPVTVLDPTTNAPMTDAVPLQEDGSYAPTEPPYFIPFQEFPQISFEGLNIPQDILYAAEGGS